MIFSIVTIVIVVCVSLLGASVYANIKHDIELQSNQLSDTQAKLQAKIQQAANDSKQRFDKTTTVLKSMKTEYGTGIGVVAKQQEKTQGDLDELRGITDKGFDTTSEVLDDLNKVRQKMDATYNGISVKGFTKMDKLQLGDKFTLSGVGDGYANDDWLRVMGKDGKNYSGGVASGKLYSKDFVHSDGNVSLKGDMVFNGDNKWILHTPDDGRQILYVAPTDKTGKWNWNAKTQFQNDGSIDISSDLRMENARTLYNKGRQHIHGEEKLFLLNKGGVYVNKAWGGNGELNVDGNLNEHSDIVMDNARTLYNKGRQHIHGEEKLFLLNKGGVIVSKAWGGNGSVAVEGDLHTNKLCVGDVCITKDDLARIKSKTA
jgi:uncharacterized membrane-anchored protein YhcB (DUF1043 family)